MASVFGRPGEQEYGGFGNEKPKNKKAMTVLEFISLDKEVRELYESQQKEYMTRSVN